MITLEQLITNELKMALEHEPTQEELHALSEHLATQHIKYLVELDLAINNWMLVATKKCTWCGEYWLPSEMIHTNTESFCCDQCKHDWEEEHGVA